MADSTSDAATTMSGSLTSASMSDLMTKAATTMSGSMAPDVGPQKPVFTWQDYLVFIASIVITAAIGLIYSFCTRKDSSSEELLVASRSMNFFVIGLSLLATTLNSVFIIGVPADAIYYGFKGIWIVIALFLAPCFVAHVVIPTFYKMRITSAYEYLERRYNYTIRVMGSFVYSISVLLTLALLLYAPSLAFSQVSTLTLAQSIVISGVICTIYTCLGGLKAVVITDTIQMFIIVAGIILLTVMGVNRVGNLKDIWEINREGGRLNFIDTDPDPRTRHTVWGQIFGQFIGYSATYVSNQMIIQRYLATKSLKQAQISIYLMFWMIIVLVLSLCLLGAAIFANYRTRTDAGPLSGCDPIVLNLISDGDQVVPYFLMEILGEYPGLPGVITAAIFAAALSSVSSALNSLAAVMIEDFIKPGYYAVKERELPKKAGTYLSVGLALLFGLITIGMSFAAQHFTANLIEASPTVWTLAGGSLAGVFIMGLCFPWVNSWGAGCGMVVSLAIGLWLGVGSALYKEPGRGLLPVCPNSGLEYLANLTRDGIITAPPPFEPQEIQSFYEISYTWYGVVTIGSALIVGNIVSLLTMKCSEKPPKEPYLYYAYADNCCCCCPESFKEFCRCGIDFSEETQKAELTKYVYKDGELAVSKHSHDNPAYNSSYNDLSKF